MTPAAAIIQRLKQIAAVTAMVGTRIYRTRLPQSPTYPAIRVSEISETYPAGHLRGQGDVTRSRIQVDAYTSEASGTDPAVAMDALTSAIAGTGAGTGLQGWTGTIDGVKVSVVLPADRTVTYEPGDLRVLVGRQDFFVWTQMV